MAIATVADVVPLIGENRAIVKLGLAGLNNVRNVGLRAILDVSGLAEGEIPSARRTSKSPRALTLLVEWPAPPTRLRCS